jgi:hypothetical protein
MLIIWDELAQMMLQARGQLVEMIYYQEPAVKLEPNNE